METSKSVYRLKEDYSGKTYGPPERYQEDNIGKTTLEDGKDYWHILSDDYVKEAVNNVKDLVQPKTSTFLHALSFECNSKLCIHFLSQFFVYFHI